jgi:hypothetical protein
MQGAWIGPNFHGRSGESAESNLPDSSRAEAQQPLALYLPFSPKLEATAQLRNVSPRRHLPIEICFNPSQQALGAAINQYYR